MRNPFRLALLGAALVVTSPVLRADDAADAALAAKLVGSWEGRWEYAEVGGKLTARISAASGSALKGETKWYATVAGDFPDRFNKAKVKDGKLTATQQTMDFEVTISEDGTSMKGTWTSPVASGPMHLKKKAD
jgi:hypothetical protein